MMKTRLKLVRRHMESGFAKGVLNSKKVDFSWSSNDLTINGKVNPEDHPLADKVEEIFRKCDEIISKLHPDKDECGVPFTADFDENGVSNLVVSEGE